MAETVRARGAGKFRIRYRGRGAQVGIYLGKMLRMFIYQNDWKVLPMAALIAGLVGMVIQKRMFINMEGTLMGAFALVCVCVWNGCFNSIQVICRERDVIKREHRSGMHITSYVASHMIYQALLCLGQTLTTWIVTRFVTGVKYPVEGMITPLFAIDFMISMFLITYASDMMSLWVSSLAHTTTTAMTIMPFVLIFQLVFSGGMLTLPDWTKPLTGMTISNPGLRVIASQADTNHQPYATISSMIEKMGDSEVSGTINAGQVLDAFGEGGILEEYRNTKIVDGLTVADVLTQLESIPDYPALREESFTLRTTVNKVLDAVGRDRVKAFLEEKAAEANYNPDYEYDPFNILDCWTSLLGFVLLFAFLTTVTLEFIDRDRR